MDEDRQDPRFITNGTRNKDYNLKFFDKKLLIQDHG